MYFTQSVLSSNAGKIISLQFFPGAEVFVNSVMKKVTLLWVIDFFKISISAKDWPLSALVRLMSITSFKLTSFKERVLRGDKEDKYLRTLLTSHVTAYFGTGGFKWYIPLSNRKTKGCCPIGTPSIG